jgi:hypothetical protein
MTTDCRASLHCARNDGDANETDLIGFGPIFLQLLYTSSFCCGLLPVSCGMVAGIYGVTYTDIHQKIK